MSISQNVEPKLPTYEEAQRSMNNNNDNRQLAYPSAPNFGTNNNNNNNNINNTAQNRNAEFTSLNVLNNNFNVDSTGNSLNQRSINEQRFREILTRHEISPFFSSKIQNLFAFKIVYLLDDSGSMNYCLEDSPLNKGLFKATRWDELREFMRISIDVATVFNPDGCDVYFLNRPIARSVKKLNDLDPYFVNRPDGYTPINRSFRQILYENRPDVLGERKMLIIIVTDGEPTDERGKEDIIGFRNCLLSRPPNVYTTILACTDDDSSMQYLNHWDKRIPRLDVVDDYRSEKKEILKVQGQHFRFTYGDYVAKSLVGSTDPEVDNLDESVQICCNVL